MSYPAGDAGQPPVIRLAGVSYTYPGPPPVAALKDAVFRDYIAALQARKGEAEAKRVLEVRRWNSNIYPNLSFMSQFQQLRVVHPVAVDRTVVYTYSFRLKGAPQEMFRNTISFANTVNGTGSLVLTDDLEIYHRIGMGLGSEGAEWIEVGRGFDSDMPDDHGGRRRIGKGGDMRGENDARMSPKRVLERQRLLAEDIEYRGRNLPRGQRRQQVFFDEMRAARGVDERRAPR